jgi:hypothetical protein
MGNNAPQILDVRLPADPEYEPLPSTYPDSSGLGIRAAGYEAVRSILRLDKPVPMTGVDGAADRRNEVALVRADLIGRHIEQRRATGHAALNGF